MSLYASNKIICNAARETIYNIICDSSRWPDLFEPCISITPITRLDNFEHVRITALVNNEEMQWESKRTFLKEIFGINSKVVKPMLFVKSMETFWRILPINALECVVILEHVYDIVEKISNQIEGIQTKADAAVFVKKAINNNSSKELLSIKKAAESPNMSLRSDNLNWSMLHSIVCHCSPSQVYDAIRETKYWPSIIDSCISTTVIEKHRYEQGDIGEDIKIEAKEQENIVSWVTHRRYFPEIFRIDFYLKIPMPFLKSMKGEWRVTALQDNNSCLLSVIREFELLENISGIRKDIQTHNQAKNIIDKFVAENAENEMLAIQYFAENRHDSIRFKSRHFLPFKRADIYSLLWNVKAWPKLLPHCEQVKIIYEDATHQEFIMKIKTKAGKECFRSIRTCDMETYSISYFQPIPPEILKSHSGRWLLNEVKEGTEITSEHDVQIDISIAEKFFNDLNIFENKKRIKKLIMSNSQATIDACHRRLSCESVHI